MFPMVSPQDRGDRSEEETPDSSSDGVSRLSLSMVDLNPPSSPQPLRSNQTTRGETADSCTVPDLLVNCGICGKQFISERYLKDHSDFCRLDGRGRLGNSEASTLAQTTDTALASLSSSLQRGSVDSAAQSQDLFTDSPALPLYMQRALSVSTNAGFNLPSVAPLPLPASPSILASPTEVLRDEDSNEDYLEEEISTFLECLRSDMPASQKWASRRAKIGRVKSEHSLCVSSEDDELDTSISIQVGSKTGLVLAPVAPPLVPMSSNIYSPIPHQRSSFDQETSMTTSFLAVQGPMGSPCSPILATRLPSVSESLEALCVPGRTSPTFGRMSLRSSVTDSAMTFAAPKRPEFSASNEYIRASQRVACKCCGRKFATPVRLERHEAICERVFGRSRSLRNEEESSFSETVPERVDVETPSPVACKYCGRSFDHCDKLKRHEHVCLSVFKGRRRDTSQSRSKSPRADVSSITRSRSSSFVSTSGERSLEEPGTAVRTRGSTNCEDLRNGGATRGRGRRTRVTSFESISIDGTAGPRNRNWRVQKFPCLMVMPPPQAPRADSKSSVGIQTVNLALIF